MILMTYLPMRVNMCLLCTDSLHIQCVHTSVICGIESIIYHRGLQKTFLHNISIWHRLQAHFCVSFVIFSSDSKKTVESLDWEETDDFLVIFPSFSRISYYVFYLKRIFLCLFPFVAQWISYREREREFIHLSVYLCHSARPFLLFSWVPSCMQQQNQLWKIFPHLWALFFIETIGLGLQQGVSYLTKLSVWSEWNGVCLSHSSSGPAAFVSS
jgi:hypothetical protein